MRHCDTAMAPVEAVVVPSAHAVHTAAEAPPSLPEKRPSGQSIGAAVPAAGAYFPAGAGVQETAPGEEKVPAAQVAQALSAAAPGDAPAFPAGHVRHAEIDCPGTLLKVPAAQGRHCASLVAAGAAPKKPAGQSAQKDALAVSAKVPAGHAEQRSDPEKGEK